MTGSRARLVSVEGLWTPDDLAVFLGIPEKTLREWRYKGYGPGWAKMGKHVRYNPDTVRSWVAERGESGAA
ncbi:helix-turn-helix domain-containing protein [Amycolatopsis sp. H20-H5]|uniref:helix-turn-helix domain-containing protein n=1 Tax=Amycolatopsis sp. H20-H5 TaxID=3046309 RepID=UPI002DBE80A9|nr:helix-turn-helix domain-containing protein [Amycolatopsis sp. H20-H5]MEC3978622.1 helix-turn-helix domain-containing protein [Amycolatopsis sp. H20-H5]